MRALALVQGLNLHGQVMEADSPDGPWEPIVKTDNEPMTHIPLFTKRYATVTGSDTIIDLGPPDKWDLLPDL